MIKLGKIYYNDELVNHEMVDYIEYVKSDTAVLDLQLPSLVVGWSFLKKIVETNNNSPYYDDISGYTILNNQIIPNLLHWEFSFPENKHRHISGIEEHVNNIPIYYFSSRYTYINLDPIFFSIESTDELINLLPKVESNFSTYVYKNDMIYILCDHKITGIDLKIYEYFNFDIEKIKHHLETRSVNYFNDTDGLMYQEYYKKLPNFDKLKRYMPVFLLNP